MRLLTSFVTTAALSFLLACGGSDPAPAPAPAPDPVDPVVGAATETTTPEATPAAPATPPIALNAEGSSISFVARKNDEADVAGTFTKLSGSATIPNGDLMQARGSIEFTLFGGVDTKDPARDLNIANAFFEAFDASGPKGTVSLNNMEVEPSTLEVGGTATGNAFVDVGAGLSMTGLALPVSVTRTESGYTVTVTEPTPVSIEKLGMNDRKAKMMELCQHKSVDDAVKVSATLVFGG